MSKKITITRKQADQFNQMRVTLIKISKGYMTPDQLRKNSEKQYGLEFEECIEMVYENIQEDARLAVKGIKAIIIEIPENKNESANPTT